MTTTTTNNENFFLNPPTTLFNWLAESDDEIIIFQGGTGSGKTYAILQYLIFIAVSEKSTITVVGAEVPHLKAGAQRDFESILSDSHVINLYVESYSPHKRLCKFKNGSIIEFVSFDKDDKAKGAKRDYVFVNEANRISFELFKFLNERTNKKVFLDFNPSLRFWAHDLKNKKGVGFFRSWYIHNPYLSKKVIDTLLSYKLNDPYSWHVMGLGKTGSIEGLVLPKCFDVANFPNESERKYHGYGLDFGFSDDPTVLVEFCVSDNNLYVRELVYSTGLFNSDLLAAFKENNIRKDDIIIADSANPKDIAELRRGGYNVLPCKKGEGSIEYGIKKIKEYNLFITSDSSNIWFEQRNYVWNKNKTKPVDRNNHAIDALRYVSSYFFQNQQSEIFTHLPRRNR